MAFHQNLEADRIDGFNLFSAFVRVPLLVLNGILGNDGTSSSDNIDRDTLRNSGAEKSISSGNDSNGNLRAKGTDSSNELMQRRQPSNTSTMAHSGTSDSSESLTDTCNNNNSGIKRTKKMSWSDESGLPLVWESEEVRRENLLIRCLLKWLVFYCYWLSIDWWFFRWDWRVFLQLGPWKQLSKNPFLPFLK